jgi:hypothetical protein
MVRQEGGALQRRARSVGDVNETLIHHLKIWKNIQACNFSVCTRAPKRVGQSFPCSVLVPFACGDRSIVLLWCFSLIAGLPFDGKCPKCGGHTRP